MIGADVIILNTKNGRREILPCPFMLISDDPFSYMEDGKFNKLFFYEHWIDEAYKANLADEILPDEFKTEKHLIDFGQDFNKFYIGYLNVDFDNKSYSIPIDQQGRIDDLKAIGEVLFKDDTETRRIIIFKPTRPSDINLALM
ncbi:MAG: hypothetical protein PSX81_04725 [bacterium]|nr:hypothetical protein [bacterium]